MPHEVTPDPMSLSVANSSPTNDDDAARLVRLTTLRGAIDIAGLSPSETTLIFEAWSRCNPRLISGAEANSEPASDTLIRNDNEYWNVFHERVVYRATAAAIGSGQGSLLMFHGAALKDPESPKTFVLVAESGGGKTTATRTLGRSFEYLTDETVGIDADYSVFQFPKPLSILEGDLVRPKIQHGPDELELLAPSGPANLSLVCLLHRDKDGNVEAPFAEHVNIVDAISLIAPQTSSLSRMDRGLVRLCEAIDRTGGVRRLHYSEASDLTRLMADLLHARPHATAATAGLNGTRPAELTTSSDVRERWIPAENLRPLDTPEARPVGLEYMRLNVDDAVYFDDGTLCVLMGEKFTMLNGVGPLVWELLESPMTLEDIVEEARDIENSPADVDRILSDALESLLANGIITRGDRY
ncbi:PqqD family protein [Neomicrococcus aestuarii]|nr:PqqD family protein [Neomicrococcus aestuarii]